jgi:hypothetical protein
MTWLIFATSYRHEGGGVVNVFDRDPLDVDPAVFEQLVSAAVSRPPSSMVRPIDLDRHRSAGVGEQEVRCEGVTEDLHQRVYGDPDCLEPGESFLSAHERVVQQAFGGAVEVGTTSVEAA